MDLTLQREIASAAGTAGHLTGSDSFFSAYTLEPPLGTGAIGEAIPAGRYQVRMMWSPHFQQVLAAVLAVPGRTHILLHDGNTEADTTGCILVGWHRLSPGQIADSDGARRVLQAQIVDAHARTEPVWLTVLDPPVTA